MFLIYESVYIYINTYTHTHTQVDKVGETSMIFLLSWGCTENLSLDVACCYWHFLHCNLYEKVMFLPCLNLCFHMINNSTYKYIFSYEFQFSIAILVWKKIQYSGALRYRLPYALTLFMAMLYQSVISWCSYYNTGVSYIILHAVIAYTNNSVFCQMQALSICVLSVGRTYRWHCVLKHVARLRVLLNENTLIKGSI